MSSWLIALMAIFLLSCAPSDRPLKGSKNHPQEDNKIKESAYYGNSADVIAYAAYRLLEPKRILDIALRIEKLDPNQAQLADFDNLPGFQIIKSCWSGKNEVLIDVLQNQPNYVSFKLKFVNCTLLSGWQVSTKVNGFESFQLYFDHNLEKSNSKVKRKLSKVIYSTQGLSHVFKANSKHQRFTETSKSQLQESRSLEIIRRPQGEYYFSYYSQGNFEQEMLSNSFRVMEPQGKHDFIADGNFIVDKRNVIKVVSGSLELNHLAKRSVFLKKGTERHIFDNEKNHLFLSAQWNQTGLVFDTECGFINGNLESVTFQNFNEKRNRFFDSLDEQDSSKITLNYLVQKGSAPELIYVQDSQGKLLKSQPAKCYLKNDKLINLAQPKTPFEFIFLN
ncbi:MAG: hypothetical protein H6625_01175 [Bdellovibrionaceae bacterium]|nr:hypothetical protein [Pseudobdellovibrionaceae bacterium]